jgi:N-acetyl-beta-hexosaminidase
MSDQTILGIKKIKIVDINNRSVMIDVSNSEYHLIDGIRDQYFEYVPIISIKIGRDIVCYGKALINVGSVNKYEYKHLEKGDYGFEKPFVFTSFHARDITR